MTRARLIGSEVKRVEDPRLITGAGTYVGDLAPPGMVHAELVRSPYASAVIRSIDTSAASEMPGVIAVYVAADLNPKVQPPPGASPLEGPPNPSRSLLAEGRVRFVGDPYAVVVA